VLSSLAGKALVYFREKTVVMNIAINIGPLAAKFDSLFSDVDAWNLGYGPSDLRALVKRQVLFSAHKNNTQAPPEVLARVCEHVYCFR